VVGAIVVGGAVVVEVGLVVVDEVDVVGAEDGEPQPPSSPTMPTAAINVSHRRAIR